MVSVDGMLTVDTLRRRSANAAASIEKLWQSVAQMEEPVRVRNRDRGRRFDSCPLPLKLNPYAAKQGHDDQEGRCLHSMYASATRTKPILFQLHRIERVLADTDPGGVRGGRHIRGRS